MTRLYSFIAVEDEGRSRALNSKSDKGRAVGASRSQEPEGRCTKRILSQLTVAPPDLKLITTKQNEASAIVCVRDILRITVSNLMFLILLQKKGTEGWFNDDLMNQFLYISAGKGNFMSSLTAWRVFKTNRGNIKEFNRVRFIPHQLASDGRVCSSFLPGAYKRQPL